MMRQIAKGLTGLLYLGVLFFVVSPLVAVATSGYLEGLQYIQWHIVVEALYVSFKSCFLASVGVVGIGLPVAYFMTQVKYRYKAALDFLIYIPTMMPPAVTGLFLLMTFGREGMIGSLLSKWGIHFVFSTSGVVLVLLFVGLPLFIKGVVEHIRAVDENLYLSAQVEGCTDGQAFMKITLPIAKEGILQTFLVTFSRMFAEFGATMMFAGNIKGKTQTLPLAIYTAIETNFSEAVVMACLTLLSLFLFMLLINWGGKKVYD